MHQMTTSRGIEHGRGEDTAAVPRQPAQPRKRFPVLVFLVGILVGAVATAGFYAGYQAWADHRYDQHHKPLLVVGAMTLLGPATWEYTTTAATGECTGTAGYADIHEGATVTPARSPLVEGRSDWQASAEQ